MSTTKIAIKFNDLLESGVHYGHTQRTWNPEMAPYIYGVRRKLHIINLLKTRPLLQKALDQIGQIASNNGKILFVATKRAAQDVLQEQAQRCGMPYVNKRWPGGMLTNFKTILQSVKRMKQLEEFIQSDQVDALKKKERLSIQRDLNKLQASFNGIRDMTSLPDCLFIIDVGNEKIAVQEANKLGIPVMGIVDTNCSPKGIDFVVPGNDDSQKSIALYASLVADVITQQREKIKAKIQASKVKVSGKATVTVVKKSDKASKEAAEVVAAVTKERVTTEGAKEASGEIKAAPAAKKVIKVSAKQVAQAKAKTVDKSDAKAVKAASGTKQVSTKSKAAEPEKASTKTTPRSKKASTAKAASASKSKLED